MKKHHTFFASCFTCEEASSSPSALANARLSRDETDIPRDATGEPSNDEARDSLPPLRDWFKFTCFVDGTAPGAGFDS